MANVKLKNICNVLLVVSVFAIVADGAYLGCFRENRRRPVYHKNPGAIKKGTLTPIICSGICGAFNYVYAGLRSGEFCFCSNTAPMPGLPLEDDGNCTMPCVGDNLQYCGSVTHVQVYDTVAPIDVVVDASPKVVATGDVVTLTASVQTNNPNYSLSMDYGDEAGKTEYVVSGTGLLDRTYHMAGEYTIDAYATTIDQLLPDVATATSVVVQSPVGGVTVDCATYMATYEPDWCLIHVNRGTDLNITVSYNDGTQHDSTFPIADADEHFFGNPVQENLQTPLASGASGTNLVVHQFYAAHYPGTLVGLEFTANVSSGSVPVYVYRPSCAGEYCYESNDCVAVGACNQLACGGNYYCSDIDACCPGPTSRTPGLIPATTYSSVYTTSVTMSAGYNYVDLPDEFEILPGDVLAHQGATLQLLANTEDGTAVTADMYCSVTGPTDFSDTDCTSTSVLIHQLKAIYAQKSSVYLPLEFTVPGNITVQATAHNTGLGSAVNDTLIIVVEGVDAAIIVEPICYAANEPSTIAVLPYTGDPATLYWNFGDGGMANMTSTTSVSYTYANIGNYDLSVNITNPKSFKYNMTSVCVEERIAGFSMSTLNTYVEVGVLENIGMTMVTGSNYTCQFTFTYSDGTVVTTTRTYLDGLVYPYDFYIAGNVTYYANCSNHINWQDDTVTVRAVERITVVQLTPPGAMANVPFNILLAWATGTDVTVTLSYDTVPEIMTLDEANRQATSGQKLEPVTGVHNVQYVVSNVLDPAPTPVNAIFSIEVAITNPVIVCTFVNLAKYVGVNNDQAVIAAGTDVQCTVDMDAGTSAVIDFDYGDGLTHTESVGVGVPWASNSIPFPIVHTFTVTQFCAFTVTVSNGFNSVTENFPVWVMVGVHNVQLNPQPPEKFIPPAVVIFNFTVIGPPPNDVTCYIEWGDGNNDEIYPCDVTTNYTHEYLDRDGNLDLFYKLTNHVSEKNDTFPVYIVTPIVDKQCYSYPKSGAPAVPLDFVFKAWRSPAAGILDLTFDCDVNVPGNEPTRKRQYNSPDGEDIQQCTFANRGNYTMSVTATSLLETETCLYNVEIIYPVTESYTFFAQNDPKDYEMALDCSMDYVLNYYGPPMPDYAIIEYDYGDGSQSGPVAFNPSHTHTHVYATHGHYQTTITIYNDASSSTRTVPSGCYAQFLDTTVTVKREPFVPVDSPYLPGFGVLQNKFRTDELLKIEASHASGTFVYWEVTAVSGLDIFACNSTDPGVITMAIDVVGTFDITVTAKNPLYTGPPQTQTVEFMKPVNGTVITDHGNVTNAYVDKYFEVTMTSHGTAMCTAVNFNDPSSGNTVQLYGDAATCGDAVASVPNGYFTGATTYYDSTVDTSSTFMVKNQYTQQGTFKIEMYSWNEFSTDFADFEFAVSGIDCSAPNIDIKGRQRNFRYPPEFPRSRRIKIVGITDIACPNTLNNKKNWTATRWNDTTNEPIEEIDLSIVPSAINSELAMEPLYLPYGQYRLDYKVTMITTGTEGEQFSGSAETFIKVVKSPLVVQLLNNSMSRVSVGPAQVITISPRQFSYDPDVNTTSDTDVFELFKLACRDATLNESFTDESVLNTALNLTDLPFGHVDMGGCFQQGSAYIDNFDGSVTFRTDILKINHTYEFLAKGYKDDRTGEAVGQIEVKEADPPVFTIGFKIPSICFQSSRGMMCNPNSQLGLVGTVTNPCTGCTYSFFWQMFAYDYQYCGEMYNCWRNLAYLSRYIEGTLSQELTIHTEVFSHYFEIDIFQVRLHVTDDLTGVTGTTYFNLTRNHPPSGGNCTISPTTGISAHTNFTLDCQTDAFTDDEGDVVENHKVTCQLGDRTVDVASDDKFWQNKFLPVGNSLDGDILKCNVSVSDDRGAIGIYPMHDVQVQPLPLGDMRQMLLSMQTDTADLSDLIGAIANLDETSSYANAMQGMLSVLSEDDEFIEFKNMGTALSYTGTDLNSDKNRPGAFETLVDDPDKMEEYEQVRDAGAQLVGSLVNTLSLCTVESTDETIRQADTIAALSSNAAFLHREAQGQMTDLLELGIQNMKNNLESLTVEEIESIGQSTLDACSNIEQAATLAMDHPTNSDLESQVEAVPYFSSNMDSTMDDVPIFTDDAHALRSGKQIMNRDDQGEFATENLGRCNSIQDDIVLILATQKPRSNEPTILKSGSMETAVLKNNAIDLQNQTLNTGGCDVKLPANMFAGATGDDTLIMTLTAKRTPGAPLENNSPMSRYSRELSVGFKYPNGTARRITNLATPIELGIKQDPNQPRFNESLLDLANPSIVPTREDEYLFYHQITVINKRAAIQLRFRPTNKSVENQLLVLANFQDMPHVTTDRSQLKEICMIPRHTSMFDFAGDNVEYDPYTCFIDADIVGDNVGEWKIGVRQMLATELDAYPSITSLPLEVPAEWKANKDFFTNYILYPIELTCAYTEPGSSVVRTNGVKPTPFSNEDELKCQTTHLTTFAGGWVVAPNTIDWNFVFANADFLKNPTLYVTEIVIILVYIIAMIWARRQDKQDVEKLGLAPLLDNDPKDKYYYEILVSTGMRRGAGTDSKVHFILSGEEEETEVRTFTDKKRKIFTRGSTDGFLMAVNEPIGPLTYLRIWHDNSGKGRFASWYLNHVLVRDVQTDKKYYFITNKWFAVEEDDGQVDRVIPVAGKEQMTEFSHLFQKSATKNLSDGHLWFSVLARPPQSRFTRCQRVSCCLCLLFSSMLANAMFYNTATSDNNAFQFGPFAITSEQIFIGVAANLIIFPINFLLITIFRKSRPRKLRPSRVEEALKSVPERSTSMADVNMRVKSSMDFERPGSSFLMDVKRSQSSMSRPESSMTNAQPKVEKKKKKKCELPWWFVIIGWILLFLAVLVSAAFVTFYGIMFQDIKCKKWITSMLVSFFTSIFFTQPIKVFLFAIIFSLIIKNPGGDEDELDEEEESKRLKEDEQFLHEEEEDEFGIVSPRKPLYKPKPPDSKALEEARSQRLKEIYMWSIIREILFYAFFLWILLVISYRSVSTDSYNYKSNMQKVFIVTNNTNQSYPKIHNTGDYWKWAKSGMLRGLRAGPYYNNFPPFYMRGYINDKQSRLMGYAVLRQARIQPDSCKVPKVMEKVIPECNSHYEITEEQDQDYGPGWTSTVNATRDEYKFRTAESLNGFPYWGNMAFYGGGGYVIELNKDYFDMIAQFDQLEQEGWLDRYTRAVFLEFTVYNPSINLFSVSTLLAEFRPSGGVFTSFRFEPCNLLPYMTSALLFQIVCEIFYVLFSLFFVIKLFKCLYQQKFGYFKQFWNLVDLGICSMSVTAIVIYFYRLVCINELTEYFKETHGNEYMKFQYVGYWSEIFNYIIGFLVFFATLKFLKLLRFNRKISLLADTLNNSSRDLIHFSIIFNIVFLAFIQLFYLIYGKHLDIFKTVTSSCEAGIVMMMGKFDIYNMLGVNQWLTQIFLFLFVVSITFIVVNMLLSILNDTFSAVRNDKNKQKNDYEIVDFMLSRFKLWTGIGRDSTTISPADMEKERNKNYRNLETQIDHFPDQIDRFLASISNMYMGDVKFDNFLQKGMAKKMAEKAAMQEENYDHPAPRFRGAQRLSHGARGMTDVQTD